jgi:hypothetical protein
LPLEREEETIDYVLATNMVITNAKKRQWRNGEETRDLFCIFGGGCWGKNLYCMYMYIIIIVNNIVNNFVNL